MASSKPTFSKADNVQQEQINALSEQVAALEDALTEVQTFLRENWSTRPQQSTTPTGDGLFPCNATPNCQGHKTQQHVQIHQKQVARKKQTAS